MFGKRAFFTGCRLFVNEILSSNKRFDKIGPIRFNAPTDFFISTQAGNTFMEYTDYRKEANALILQISEIRRLL